MTAQTYRQPAPRVLLTVPEAAGSCGLSETMFRSEVLPHVRKVRVGKSYRIPVKELFEWADRTAARTNL